jgi:hypothetical protein
LSFDLRWSTLGQWNWAKYLKKDSDQGTFLPGEWKCNLFVAEVLAEGGFQVPLYNTAGTWATVVLKFFDENTARPPTARQWYDSAVPGTTLIGTGKEGLEKSWPGDISTSGSHVGIVVGPQKTIAVRRKDSNFEFKKNTTL